MMSGSLPRRYARALIQLAQEANQVEAFGKALDHLVSVLQTIPLVLQTLANDFIDFNQRIAAVEEIATQAGYPQYLKNFLCLVVKKERAGLLPEITREYQRYQDEILGIVRVTVETPQAVDPALIASVEKILGGKLKKKVIAHGEAKPEIIGGIVLKVDHVVYDGSIRTELERLKEKMLQA